MIERMSDLPDDVLGFAAKGRVTAEDYETVVIPAVEERFSQGGKVRLLYWIGEDFTGFEPAAMWDDARLGLRHPTGWERVALVSDVEWVRLATQLFALLLPGKVRVFHNDELAEARQWVSQ